MKRLKFLVPIAILAVFFTVSFAVIDKKEVTKDVAKSESAIGLPSTPSTLEVKEAYKVDDAEFTSAVATKNSISGISFGATLVAAFIGILALFYRAFRNFDFNRLVPSVKTQLGIRVGALAIAILTVNGTLAALALFLPIATQWSHSMGIEADEFKTILEGISKTNGEAIEASVKKEVTEATKGLMKSEELAVKLEALGLKDGAIEKLTKAAETQGEELRKIMQGVNPNAGKSIEEIVAEKGDLIKELAHENKSVKFKIGANKTVVQSGSVTGSTLSYREQGIGQLAAPLTVFDKVFRTVNLSEADMKQSNGVITYLDVTAETNNAAETAESTGAVVGTGNKPESAITWQEYSANFRVIADTIPVTRQAYRHLGFIASEIDRLLRKNQAQRKDLQIYKGDGNAPNLKGIYTYTTAATLASLPNYQGLIDPNLYDLIANLRVYVANGGAAGTGAQSKYNPNVVFMNPADILRYKLAKAADGHYLLPPFVSQDGSKIDMCSVIESATVTANTLALGDASYPTIYQAEDVVIEMGLVNDQFLKNQWTIRAEQEVCFLQRNADLGSFTKITDITAAIEALAKP